MTAIVKDESDQSWHLDKKVPLALISAIIVQSVAIAFAFGGLFNRVDNIEANLTALTGEVRTMSQFSVSNASNRFTDADAMRLEQRIMHDIDTVNSRVGRLEDRVFVAEQAQ